jgi:hypothetical protein
MHNGHNKYRNDKSATLIVHLHHWIEANTLTSGCFITLQATQIAPSPSYTEFLQGTMIVQRKHRKLRKPQGRKHAEVRGQLRPLLPKTHA